MTQPPVAQIGLQFGTQFAQDPTGKTLLVFQFVVGPTTYNIALDADNATKFLEAIANVQPQIDQMRRETSGLVVATALPTSNGKSKNHG